MAQPLLYVAAGLLLLILGAKGAHAAAPRPGARPTRAVSATTVPVPLPAPPVVVPQNQDSPIGVVLDAVTDWATNWPFVNVFLTSRGWISGDAQTWDNKWPVDVDANGWVRSLRPGQIVRTLMFGDSTATDYPKGDYIVLFDGDGDLKFSDNVVVVSAVKGRWVIRPNPAGGGIELRITRTKVGDYLRKIRVLLPGGVCETNGAQICWGVPGECTNGKCLPFEQIHESQVFNPMFLKALAPYSTLRFMLWANSDGDATYAPPVPQVNWRDRPKLTDARWSRSGVPVEVMIDLANRLGADPWFNIPHLASDDYVRQYAQLVYARLKSDRLAYVEYTNEAFNDDYPQAKYVQRLGLKARLGGDARTAGGRFYSRRAVQIFKIFEKVFGADANRLRRVMGSFVWDTGLSDIELGYLDAAQHTDGLAVAPYFGLELGLETNGGRVDSLDTVFAMIGGSDAAIGDSLPLVAQAIAAQAAVAANYSVPLYGYEGGQHLRAYGKYENDPFINGLFDRANRDQRMNAAYGTWLASWRANGGTIMIHHNDCQRMLPGGAGRWGALERIDQDPATAPKYTALLQFIQASKKWW